MEESYREESGDTVVENAEEEEGWQLKYSLKLINRKKTSELKPVRVGNWKRFENLKDLREFLSSKLPTIEIAGEKPEVEVDVGYYRAWIERSQAMALC